jgi:hypothetical protein
MEIKKLRYFFKITVSNLVALITSSATEDLSSL